MMMISSFLFSIVVLSVSMLIAKSFRIGVLKRYESSTISTIRSLGDKARKSDSHGVRVGITNCKFSSSTLQAVSMNYDETSNRKSNFAPLKVMGEFL